MLSDHCLLMPVCSLSPVCFLPRTPAVLDRVSASQFPCLGDLLVGLRPSSYSPCFISHCLSNKRHSTCNWVLSSHSLTNLALFYLKLQAKLLQPSSVIQTIIEDIQEIHDISQSHLLFKLKEKLVTLGLSEADTSNVINVPKTEDLFRTCNTQSLQTEQRRKNIFKNSFNYRASSDLSWSE